MHAEDLTTDQCRSLTVAVAIATYRREAVLVETINEVFRQDPRPDEILVVDQTPEHDPDTLRFLTEMDREKRLRWIRQSPPNLPLARNRAIAETACDVIIFIDDDVQLVDKFIHAHLRQYENPEVVAVAGRTIQMKNYHRPTRTSWPTEFDFLFFPLDLTERRERIANFIGANHSIRRSAVVAIGGYDPNYLNGMREDSDVALRLWKSGGLVVFEPAALAHHLQATSGGCGGRETGRNRPDWMRHIGEEYFWRRHFYPRWPFWKHLLYAGPRWSVFTRENVLRRPWRIIPEGVGWLRAVFRARRMSSSVKGWKIYHTDLARFVQQAGTQLGAR